MCREEVYTGGVLNMAYLAIVYILLHALPVLFTAEVHKHPISREYGIRVCKDFKTKPVLVVGLGKSILRIEL